MTIGAQSIIIYVIVWNKYEQIITEGLFYHGQEGKRYSGNNISVLC